MRTVIFNAMLTELTPVEVDLINELDRTSYNDPRLDTPRFKVKYDHYLGYTLELTRDDAEDMYNLVHAEHMECFSKVNALGVKAANADEHDEMMKYEKTIIELENRADVLGNFKKELDRLINGLEPFAVD